MMQTDFSKQGRWTFLSKSVQNFAKDYKSGNMKTLFVKTINNMYLPIVDAFLIGTIVTLDSRNRKVLLSK